MVNEKGMSVIATWQNLLDAHCNVELSSEHVTSNNSVGYQLDVESITGHSSLVSFYKNIAKSVGYQKNVYFTIPNIQDN